MKVGEAAAGIGLFAESSQAVNPTQYVRYAVAAVDQPGATSVLLPAQRFIPGTSSVDNDGDGMADEWELANGLNPADPTDGLLDADGDGQSNFLEYRTGTDPNNPLSYFRLAAIGGSPNAGVSVTWGSVEDRFYTILRSTSLPGGFAPVATHVQSTPPQNIFLDTSATNAGPYFYRLQLE